MRGNLIDEVRKFFVGPRSTAELLPRGSLPLDMYNAGILFPKNSPPGDSDKTDGDAGDAAEDSPDEQESDVFFRQNSIGLGTSLASGAEKIRLVINYGKYKPDSDGAWARRELDYKKREYTLDLSEPEGRIDILDSAGTLESRVSWKVYDGSVLNVFLENPAEWARVANRNAENAGDVKIRNNMNSIFQPSISLHATDGTSPFKQISVSSNLDQSAEDDLFDMLYRNSKVFGSGYGCAAEWGEADCPSYVRTVVMPVHQEKEIGKFSEGSDDGRPAKVDMYDLCCFESDNDWNACKKKIAKKLSPLIDGYRRWIAEQRRAVTAGVVGNDYRGVADNNMDVCDSVLDRIEDGLMLITNEKGELGNTMTKAFVLANRAMLYQRLHFAYALGRFKNNRAGEWPNAKRPGQAFWYPFQIAFILMSLRGIAFEQAADRSTADLIWYPTGGGKTEAYLGVAAFAMLLRRLKGSPEGGLGVSVIMRYTLRLLTLQQFERASTLVCALEHLRRQRDSGLGSAPFLLGLWVGYSLTPNTHESSADALEQLNSNPHASPADGSPCQVNYCPWCGHRLIPSSNYRVDRQTKWTRIRCTNTSGRCIFTKSFSPNDALPLVTVDYDIYTRCPSMIIATVDKFARLPFRAEIANIFGRAVRRCETHGFLPRDQYGACSISGYGSHRNGGGRVSRVSTRFPPDLIVQDELHLISGPLGTMVGLYETAVDFLTRTDVGGKELRPKVIVSTATVRGAKEQVRKIFNRVRTQTFPPPGTDGSDSFFWWRTERKGKIFAGISFSQQSAKYALAKLYAALLQRSQNIRLAKAIPDNLLDSYWTLVGYFNSTRELGGANRLVEDDVVQHINFLAETAHNSKYEPRHPGTPENGIDELTGKKTQKEINEIRSKLEQPLPSSDVISVLLATSMISVGIDIDRLALMVIQGQPKTATEYIQVTGRVGRRPDAPGCIFTLFNPYKPRDLSHYENFVGFHRTMQKYVEPSTLTPFSIPAYNRAMHAVLIAMIRLSCPRLSGKTDAARFQMDYGKEATEFMLERFRSVEQVDDDDDSYRKFKTRLNVLQEEWEKFITRVESDRSLSDPVWYNNPYSRWKKGKTNPSVLMIEFAKGNDHGPDAFPLSTAESLRDVEQHIMMEYV